MHPREAYRPRGTTVLKYQVSTFSQQDTRPMSERHGGWIALFLHDLTNHYQRMLRDDAERAARRHGHVVRVFSAEKNADLQVRQIRDVVSDSSHRMPAAIMVSPVRESSLLAVMSEAITLGIPWVFLCRWSESVSSVRREFPSLPVFAVIADQHQIGSLQGKILKQLLGVAVELVYIQGSNGTSSASRRYAALQRELAGLPNVCLSRYNADWSVDGGTEMMNSWLSTFSGRGLPEFLVCAQNDDMALGARHALVASRHITQIGSPPIIGCDGLPNFGQRLVHEGQLTATVVVPSVSGRAVDELFKALATKRRPDAEVSVRVSCFPELSAINRETAGASPPGTDKHPRRRTR